MSNAYKVVINGDTFWKMPGGHFISHWTIEPEKDGFQCWYHGEYAEWSVLGGQYMRGRSGPTHKTIEEAQQWVEDNRFGEEPVEVLEHSTRVDFRMPDTAPEWFDPADAGEVWSEEDY